MSKKPFGPPPSMSERLRAMKPETEQFFETEKPQSILAMASRLSVQKKKGAERSAFTCRKQPGGVRVWRLKNQPVTKKE